jgi:hypothetical protein
MTKRKLNIEVLDPQAALVAIEMLGEIAKENGIEWALVGGLAVALYESDRNTRGVDIIASRRLSMPPSTIVGGLVQGGERYSIKVEDKNVYVDWILRKDEAKRFFETALAEATQIDGIPILTPEWLVILKHIAGRFKDQEDAIFLLRKKGLVDRKKIKEHIIKVAGKDAWAGFRPNLQRWYDLADGKITTDPTLIDS